MVVNYRSDILRLVLPVILLCISGNIFSYTPSSSEADSLLEKVFEYKKRHANANDTLTKQVYTKHTFKTLRRNPTLFLVPTMYSIAKGQRNYIRETYGEVDIAGAEIVIHDPKIAVGTIRKNRQTMPITADYVLPSIYSEILFGENVLSPFYKKNRKFYSYEWKEAGNGTATLRYTPRITNTQLVEGQATIDTRKGRVIACQMEGTFDMIVFDINMVMGDEGNESMVPKECHISSLFNFIGNKIEHEMHVVYSNDKQLPKEKTSEPSVMSNYRPMPLEKSDSLIYASFIEAKKKSAAERTTKHDNSITDKTLDLIEDNLLSSINAKSEKASIRISPLLDPLQLSYSNRRGLSYRMKIDTRYNFTENSYLTFKPRVGYNFKINRLYYSTPLRLTLNEKSNNWIELEFANGNRITNSSVLEVLEGSEIDTVDFKSLALDYFDDRHLKLRSNIALSEYVDLTIGCTYHEREAVNKKAMAELDKPTSYKSFAPLLTISYRPSSNWPLFTANYERSIKGILHSNLGYERWEFDTSYKKMLGALRKLNLRLGGGFYTDKSSNYFVDFSNFHEEYLPEGWDDDWTGNFQLLNSEWYNASRYYIRMNASYESPLMVVSRLPLLGKFIETERLYLGVVRLQSTRPYCELGYGFTNKYFSVGAFASFLNTSFQEFGCKFTFELFRRW